MSAAADRDRSGDLQVATWRRKRNRLDREAYQGPFAFFVTATTSERQRAFVHADVVERCRLALEETALQRGFSLLAYCFMPDHLHLLLEGSDGTDLAAFMKAFKQRTSFEHKQRTGQALWQKSFFDHIIRNEQDQQEILAYIRENPVRAGLVEHFDEYPFLGGALKDVLVAT